MTRAILGLDIGGANLKAATPDGRAVGVPFALWKQPDRLPAALADLVAKFPDARELAVTMTGELCDCYQTKREGVNAILDAVECAAAGRPVRVWGTGGEFVGVAAARYRPLVVAAANWHAAATFAGRFQPVGPAVVVDVGGTTTDVTLLHDGLPANRGLTDIDRLRTRELVYTGVWRTPVCALATDSLAAELFATTLDVYLVNGHIADDPSDCDTADGRPATRSNAYARLARMLGGDAETVELSDLVRLADRVAARQAELIAAAVTEVLSEVTEPVTAIRCGSGEFLAASGLARVEAGRLVRQVSMGLELGWLTSACAPAYAVAVLAAERPA